MKKCNVLSRACSLALVLLLALSFGIGTAAPASAEADDLPPTIVSLGGKGIDDGIGTLPAGVVNEPYRDKDGNPYKIVATGSAPLTYRSIILGGTAMPVGLTLDPATGEISGTPTVTGEYRISFSVENSFGSASVLGVLKIFSADDKPVIRTETVSVGSVGAQYYQRILFDGYNQSYSATLSDAPAWLKISSSGASPYLTGTPTEAGTFPFTVHIDNIAGVTSKEYTLEVQKAPIEPKIEKELFVFRDGYSKFNRYGELTVVQGKAVDIQFAASGTNTEKNPMRWELDGELPPGLEFDTDTGRLTGTVTENVTGSANNKYYYCRFIARNTNSASSTSIDELNALVVYKNGWKESVSITPDNTTVQKGGSRKFSAVVDGWGDVDQTIRYWYAIGSNLSADTKVDENGILTVGSDETNTEIKVVAIAYNNGLEVKATAVVTVVDHAHSTVKVPAKAKSCTESGSAEHFRCTVCNGMFSDAGAANSLTAEQVVIPAGHNYGTIVEKADATCCAAGMEAHYACSVCHKLFDESRVEKTAEELTVAQDPTAHAFGATNAEIPATCVSEGKKEYKECVHCHRFFTADGASELTDLTIAIRPDAHDLAETLTGVTDGHYHLCRRAGCPVGHDELQAHIPDRTEATESDPVRCTACGYIITPVLGHTHRLTAVPGVGATCTEAGRKTYYTCDGCEMKFMDAGGTEELTDESLLVIPTAHRFGAWVEEVPATTESAGTKAHKDCDFCGKHFDADGDEIEDLTIEKLPGGENPGGDDPGENPSGDNPSENPGEDPGTDTPAPAPEKNTGIGVGGIIGISIGAVCVVGIGGFSLVWFVIRKKTFAELIAAIQALFGKK